MIRFLADWYAFICWTIAVAIDQYNGRDVGDDEPAERSGAWIGFAYGMAFGFSAAVALMLLVGRVI